MRISDWSSDVCSSDLLDALHDPQHVGHAILEMLAFAVIAQPHHRRAIARQLVRRRPSGDRKSVVQGQSVSVRVDHGGRRISKKIQTYVLITHNRGFLILTLETYSIYTNCT